MKKNIWLVALILNSAFIEAATTNTDKFNQIDYSQLKASANTDKFNQIEAKDVEEIEKALYFNKKSGKSFLDNFNGMLHHASQTNDLKIVKKLFWVAEKMNAFKDLFQTNNNVDSVLIEALKTKNLKIIDQVLNFAKKAPEYKDFFKIGQYHQSVVKSAIKTEDPKIVKYMLSATESANFDSYISLFKQHNRNSLLASAILTNNEEIIDMIIKAAKDVMAYNDLFTADNSLNSVLAVAIETKNPKIVKKVLDCAKKADKEVCEKLFGANTPFSILKYALNVGNEEILKLLLEAEKELGIYDELAQKINQDGEPPRV